MKVAVATTATPPPLPPPPKPQPLPPPPPPQPPLPLLSRVPDYSGIHPLEGYRYLFTVVFTVYSLSCR